MFSTRASGDPWEEVGTEPKPLVATGNRLSYSVAVASETRLYRVAELAEVAPAGMVLIPAGHFMMGDTFGEGESRELPVHEVYVSAFYMDQSGVTKRLWDEVRLWASAAGYDLGMHQGGKGWDHPVHSVSWYDAVKWCNARSEMEGRVPAYYTSPAQTTVYRTGELNLGNDSVRWDAGYRLPTEAEWEKAARGGAAGRRFPWGDTDEITHSRANYWSGFDDAYDTSPTRGGHPVFATGTTPYTSPAGYFAPNGYGLHDMAGNLREWCWDIFSVTYYSESPDSDPRGSVWGTSRVMRGGTCLDRAFYCRVASRGGNWPGQRGSGSGFRSVLPASQ
jgi:formylglycine-generating enzyme